MALKLARLPARVDSRLGACGAAHKVPSYSLNINNSVTTLAQGYAQDCAKGTLDETLTLVMQGEKAQVLDLRMTSPLLASDW